MGGRRYCDHTQEGVILYAEKKVTDRQSKINHDLPSPVGAAQEMVMDDESRKRMMDSLHQENHQTWGAISPHNDNLDIGYRPSLLNPDGDDE